MTTSAPVTPDPAKPGWTTTEFWVAGVAPLIVSMLTLFNIGHVDLTNNPTAQAIIKIGGLAAASIGAAFYAHSRGHMKAGATIAAALKTMDVGAWLGQGLSDIGAGLGQITPVQPPVALPVGELTIGEAQPQLFTEDQLLQIVDVISPTLKTHVEQAIAELKQVMTGKSPEATVPSTLAAEPVQLGMQSSDTFEAPSFTT